MWTDLEEEKVSYYITDNFEYKTNIAIFSFNKTLVQNVHSSKYPLILYSHTVAPFLEKINQKGSIIIIENRFKRISDIRENIENFHKLLGEYNDRISFIAMFILAQNKYKKPNTNIFTMLESIYEEKIPESKEIGTQTFSGFEKDKSIIIGANAGRYQMDSFDVDENDCDRAFAHNLGINTFRTPEHMFLNSNISRKWAWKTEHIDKFLEQQKEKHEPNFGSLFDINYPKNLIFITGAIASGKTLLSRRVMDYIAHLDPNIKVDKKDINTANIGEICESLNDFNTNDCKILLIVDILYDDIFSKYLTIVSPLIKITHIELDSSREICIFLDRFRLQITKSLSVLESKKEDIAKWFLTERKKKDFINYITFPIILRTRPESFYYY